MKKVILTVLAFAFFGAFNVGEASACTCFLSPKVRSLNAVVKEAYKNSSVVFAGEVVEINQKPDGYFVEVTLKVEQKWKGEVGETIIITTGRGGGDCGYYFTVGEKYLVYASGKENRLQTNICTKTAVVKDNKDFLVLDKIVKKKVKSSPK